MISADYFKDLADNSSDDDAILQDVFRNIESNAKEGLYKLHYPSELLNSRIELSLRDHGFKVYNMATIWDMFSGASVTVIDWGNPHE